MTNYAMDYKIDKINKNLKAIDRYLEKFDYDEETLDGIKLLLEQIITEIIGPKIGISNPINNNRVLHELLNEYHGHKNGFN